MPAEVMRATSADVTAPPDVGGRLGWACNRPADTSEFNLDLAVGLGRRNRIRRTACPHSARSTTAPALTPRDWIWP